MADGLTVDSQMLRETGASLRRIAEEFAEANLNSDEVAGAIAHRGLAGAVRSFAHNWDDRRERMLRSIADLAAAATATGDGFDEVDRALGRALLGQDPLGVAMPRAGAAPVVSLRAPVTIGPVSRRPADWTPLRDRDPLPGDPMAVERAGRYYTHIADTIGSSAARLRVIAADAGMRGEAVTALRARASVVADDIGKAHQRYAAVGSALTTYAAEFEHAHDLSTRTLSQSLMAQDELNRAQIRIRAAQSQLVPPEIESPELRMATTLLAEAQQALVSAGRALDGAIAEHDDAGARAERLVNDGKTGDSLGDSRWDNAKGAFVSVLKVVNRILDGVAVAAGVLALVTIWCPPLSGFFGAVATYAAALGLLAKVLLQLSGEDMLMDIAVSVAALATLGLGRIAVGAFRTSAAGATGASRIAAGQAAATAPAARAAAGLPAHADSAAAIRGMLGTANPMTRQAAHEAVERSLRTGVRNGFREAGESLKALPRELWDDAAAIRNLDLAHPLQQMRANVDTRMLSMAGQQDAANEVRALKGVHEMIRGGDEVAAHMGGLSAQRNLTLAAAGTGPGYLAWDTFRFFDADATPAQRLNLPGSAR